MTWLQDAGAVLLSWQAVPVLAGVLMFVAGAGVGYGLAARRFDRSRGRVLRVMEDAAVTRVKVPGQRRSGA